MKRGDLVVKAIKARKNMFTSSRCDLCGLRVRLLLRGFGEERKLEGSSFCLYYFALSLFS
jgi:hypothetical protein